MIARLDAIIRHPIKSIGLEPLESAPLSKGRALPFDRHWAILTEKSPLSRMPDGSVSSWGKKINFVIGRSAPELMCITAQLDEATGTLTLSHPRAATITVQPENDAELLLDWVQQFWRDLPAPTVVVRQPDRPLTDEDTPYVAVLNRASLTDLSEKLGQVVEPERFRGNLWIDGWPAFHETTMVGKRIRIGTAILLVDRPIERCRATDTNPLSGQRDIDMLRELDTRYQTRNFGIFCKVVEDGVIHRGDEVEVL